MYLKKCPGDRKDINDHDHIIIWNEMSQGHSKLDNWGG